MYWVAKKSQTSRADGVLFSLRETGSSVLSINLGKSAEIGPKTVSAEGPSQLAKNPDLTH
jgi:hypothetical protein